MNCVHFALLLMMSSLALAQILSLGGCPKLLAMQNFDANRYKGKWYVIEKYFILTELGDHCQTAIYGDIGEGSMSVLYRGANALNKYMTLAGLGTPVASKTADARFDFTYPILGALNGIKNSQGNYWILSTNYDTYSIVWSCADFKIFNAQILWILMRSNTTDPAVVDGLRTKVTLLGLHPKHLIPVSHLNCPTESNFIDPLNI